MTIKGHRRSADPSSFRRAWTRTFGQRIPLPAATRWIVAPVAVVSLLVTGVAMAAWQVNDRTTQREIRVVQDRLGSGNVNERLNELNKKLRVAPRSGSTTAMVVEPSGDEKLDAMQPTTVSVAIDKHCAAGASTTLGQQQLALCQELIRTELAQYRFSMRMFERAKENYDRLKQIEDRRRALGANDYADVQYNTNELIALNTLMDNDRDRYQTYMAAYEARKAYIQTSRSALTRNALKGNGSLSLPGLPGI